VAEAYLLRLLGLSGFGPSLGACAVCGSTDVRRFAASQGGAVCEDCQDRDARRVNPAALRWLAGLETGDLEEAGQAPVTTEIRAEARGLLFGFSEYHLDRRLRSLPIMARATRRSPTPTPAP
jgi:DNA repair protein RecO (recombination protein O)